MNRPDFARTALEGLDNRDLRFIIENFPEPGRSYEEIAEVITTLPSTLESLLNSEFLLQRVRDRSRLLLDVSPFLLFNVLLRHSLDAPRSASQRKIINYMANLLSLFVRTDRLYRVQPGDHREQRYIVDLVEECQGADERRRFCIYSHIGNYSLFVSGLFPGWIRYRHRYGRRPVDTSFYVDFGRTYFQRASEHQLARELGLDEVFLQLAMMFEPYRAGLNRLSAEYLGGLRN